jgi:hypothetical protein
MTEQAYEYTREYVRRKHYQTGNLYRSITWEIDQTSGGVWRGFIKAGGKRAPHAELLQNGTNARLITPSKGKKAITTPQGPRAYALHPGTKPSNFMRKGINRVRRQMKRMWTDAQREAYAEQKRR